MPAYQRLRAAVLSVVIAAQPAAVFALQWSTVKAPAAGGARGGWRITDTAPSPSPGSGLSWRSVSEQQLQQDQLQRQQRQAEHEAVLAAQKQVVPPSGPTFANYRALWRDGDWLPQISNTVPVGFGPKGVMATLQYRAIDCITGAGYCSVPSGYQDWKDQVARSGDAFFDTSIGFGDSLKAVGVIVTAVSENTNTQFGGRSGNGETPFGNINLGFHLAKSFGPDTSLRLGVENLVREDCGNGSCGLPQSAYGVLTQRIRFNPDQKAWFSNAYITVGAGNGAYRPLDEQIQASIAAQRAAGCSAYGYSPAKDCSPSARRQAVYGAADFGDLTPIGALGVEVFRGFNLIGEWSGRNLNAGLSFRPFEQIGLVITPMWENLLPNCDYGCRVSVSDYPAGAPIPSNMLTERARFSIQASVDVKF